MMPPSLPLLLAAPFVLLSTATLVAAVAAVRAWRAPRPLAYALGLVERRRSGQPCIAFYAASHGELLLLEKLLPAMQAELPDAELVVIVPSPSVYAVAAERLTKFRTLCVRPLLPWGCRLALERLAPDLLVVVEFARIPQWVRHAGKLGIPVAIVNGRLSVKHQQVCRRWWWLARPMLAATDLVLAQTRDDAEQFVRHGARTESIEVAGALKYDAASYTRNTFATQRLARLAGIEERDVVLLAGSTRDGEEEIVAGVYQRLASEFPRLRLIVAPRNRHRFNRVAAIFARRRIVFERRSRLDADGADRAARVLLVDTVGELAAWWGTAQIGFVGASLTSRGGQNMVEPAALGVATCFGPHTANFRDVATLLIDRDAAVEVASERELEAFVRRCLTEPAYAAALGQRAQEVCRTQTGAMQRTCQRLSACLAEVAGPAILKFPEPATVHSAARRRAA